MRTVIKCCLALICLASPAMGEGWAGFYTPSTRVSVGSVLTEIPALGARPSQTRNVCLDAILEAQARHGIPDNLLVAIGFQESGISINGQMTIWPWSVNAAGRGYRLSDLAEAISLVQELERRGVDSIDTGCMQINRKWHPNAFPSLQRAFDPSANADYAGRFLADLKRRLGSWRAAAGAYHSQTPDLRDAYLESLDGHIASLGARLAGYSPTRGAASDRFVVGSERDDTLPSLSMVSAGLNVDLPAPQLRAASVTRNPVRSGPIWGASMNGRRNSTGGSLFSDSGSMAMPISQKASPLY